MRYIIAGGGIAGTTAAEELRRLDVNAEITLVDEEHEPLYSRVLLPHYAKGIIPREKVFLKKETWYAEKHIEWLPGMRVEAFDAKNKHVVLTDGRELPYDKFLLATGGEVRTLPYEGENVRYFHTLGDTEEIIARAASLAPGGRCVVYGGSFIACELVDVFVHRGVPTVSAFRGPYFFHRILDADSGELLNDHLRSRGVDLRPGTREPEDMQTMREDLVTLGVGIEAELGFVREAGVETNKGILTNEYLETNMQDVYAAGDVAEFLDVIAGRQLMAGNWLSAVLQGRLVAQNMAGKRTAFRSVTSYAADLAGIDVICVGDTDRSAAEDIQVFGSRAEGGVTQLFIRSGKIVGGSMVNRNGHRQPVTNAIRDGLTNVRFSA